ncbi:MAG: hypothetical protein Q4G36_02540 [Paracoccus sp. (in: a-proteobacteria)]|nr:hypothetical protein [Paracoccus sp. (in: a-proteobacteria)]
MLNDDDPEFVEGIVTLATAHFCNLTLLRALEKACPRPLGKTLPTDYFIRDREARQAIKTAHREGLFLQMRRQMPHMTDEALENRLSLIAERLRAVSHQLCARQSRRPSPVMDERDEGCKISDDLLYDLPNMLGVLAETFLREAPDGSLRVRSRLIGYWQDLILVVPPLLISSAWIYRRVRPKALNNHRDRRDAVNRMARWLCDSTLPVDDDPALDHLCRQHGLDEVHMHLMGTTEAEKVWCDALRTPQKVVGKLVQEQKNRRESGLRLSIGSGLDRLLRQEDSQLTADLLLGRVTRAATLKALLLFAARNGPETDLLSDLPSPAEFCAQERARSLRDLPPHLPMVVKEAWHICRILASCEAHREQAYAQWQLWQYVLLRAQFCRLLVQQSGQTGFDQFQYITLNELRETTELDFAERFRQIERGHQRIVDFLEGRFAPKKDIDKMVDLLGRILHGYFRFLGEDALGEARPPAATAQYSSFAELVALVRRREVEAQTLPVIPEGVSQDAPAQRRPAPVSIGKRRLRLGLVAHFIKNLDLGEQRNFVTAVSPCPECRHSRMRKDTQHQARILVSLLEQVSDLRHFIRGADAAANERHAGPEVLAPVFRTLRRAGLQRFTYHAGEDFAHLASGMRTMFEAVQFLELDAGCRLGHGTAAGLLPEAWWEGIGNSAVLPTEDRLDDLIFARYMLISNALLPERLALIDAEIWNLAMQIWADPQITPDLLTEAWLLRHLDPLSRRFRIGDPDPHRRAEALLCESAQREQPLAYRHFLRRHGIHAADKTFTARQMRDEVARGAKQIMVARRSDILDIETLRALQRCVLQVLNSRRIAIETLPSSNVRISVHQRYEQHHSLNWLGVGAESLKTPVDLVVGSDDPGIFATNLRMEYAHLMRCLREESRTSGDRFEPMLPIETLCLNAKRFCF